MRIYRILLVDDEEIIRKTLAVSLQEEGYEVITASTGEDAIRKLKEGVYDLVITDLIMEGVGGMEVLKIARQLDHEAMVMILTGYGSLESAIDALRLGVHDYLLKPYNPTELFVKVAHCLEQLELRRKIVLYEQILPVCAGCGMIRDDNGKEPGTGDWLPVDKYIERRTGVKISHGLCRACADKICPE